MMALPHPPITTDRLTLRTPEARDHAAYSAFFADSEASHFYGGPLLPYQSYGILCRDIGHWALKGFGKFVIEQDDAALGGCGIVHPEGWPGHELTWWLLPAARGQGIAQEASRAVLAWAGTELGWDRVETHFRDENIPARRLTESLGGLRQRRETFPDGIDRDIYAMPTASKVSA
ncbi:GNAT family N-acetyltransferase [Paracoccus albus]|uniref:GNAT family N-acetyltransferase n=1 Tax=Paracoccus albus TaxID=3017784 RepID=UPI0022EFE870|nr:GNAT family N-acetyltransferase [Paracoccus albus]WBU59179.1 GNAT family N-acetyltransferase [Paracoccus albus]